MKLETVGQAEGAEEVHQHGDHLGIERRVRLAEGLDIGLMELPVAAGLRALVPEHRSHRVQPDGLRLDVESMLDIGAQHARRRLGPKRERIPAPVLERVHLLLDDVRLVADPSREQLGALEEGHADLAIAIRFEDPAGRRLDTLPARSLRGQDVADAANGLDHRRGIRQGSELISPAGRS